MSFTYKSRGVDLRNTTYDVPEGLRELRQLAGISVRAWAEGVQQWTNNVDRPGVPVYPFADSPVSSLRVALSSAECGKRGLTVMMLRAALDALSDALPTKADDPETRRLGNLLIDRVRVTFYGVACEPPAMFPEVAKALASSMEWLDHLRATGSVHVERVEAQVERFTALAKRARDLDESNRDLQQESVAVVDRHIAEARKALAAAS
jgi:hypothetical protein